MKTTSSRRRGLAWITALISISISIMNIPHSSSTLESFIYAGCTQVKYNPATPYQSNVDSLLSSLPNSASSSNFKISTQNDVVYGLFQCRGDLSSSDCQSCVETAVSRVGNYCQGRSGAALQLEGCLVKYDNVSFAGGQDKSVAYQKCGDPVGDVDRGRDEVLAYLTGGGEYFRVGEWGRVEGVVQCVEDLSEAQCQDCLSEAKLRLQTDCAASPWGDMFLGKCYARYFQTYTPSHTESEQNDETDKTLALIIGIIAAATLLVVFISFFTKTTDKEDAK